MLGPTMHVCGSLCALPHYYLLFSVFVLKFILGPIGCAGKRNTNSSRLPSHAVYPGHIERWKRHIDRLRQGTIIYVTATFGVCCTCSLYPYLCVVICYNFPLWKLYRLSHDIEYPGRPTCMNPLVFDNLLASRVSGTYWASSMVHDYDVRCKLAQTIDLASRVEAGIFSRGAVGGGRGGNYAPSHNSSMLGIKLMVAGSDADDIAENAESRNELRWADTSIYLGPVKSTQFDDDMCAAE